MRRRSLLAASCVATTALAGCLSHQFSGEATRSAVLRLDGASEDAIEACEISYLEANVFDDDDPPTIDVTVRSAGRYDREFLEVRVESNWIVPDVEVLDIEARPASSEAGDDAPSSSNEAFEGFDLLDETLTAVLEDEEAVPLDRDHEEYIDVRDALVEVYDITGNDAPGTDVVIDHDGESVELHVQLEGVHGDGEAETIYFVSDEEIYRVEEHDGTPEEGTAVDCPEIAD